MEEKGHYVDETSLWHRRIGSKWDLKKGQPPWLQQCLEERLEVEISHVDVNKACGLNGP